MDILNHKNNKIVFMHIEIIFYIIHILNILILLNNKNYKYLKILIKN